MTAAPAHWRALVVLGLAALAALVILTFRVGFQASDDNDYVAGALGWMQQFPYVGTNHWRLRHTITLPTALFFQLLGTREWVVSLTNICYFSAFLGINGWFTTRFLGGRAAALATLLMLVAPGLPVVGTYLSPDVPELFYMSTAFWLLMAARAEPQRSGLWLAVGLLAGLGFINRQTAAAFVLFALAICAFAPGAPRRRYALALLAFLGVVGAEWAYLYAMTGNPLYRSQIDFNHDTIDRFAAFAAVKAQGRWIDNEGNLAVSVWLDPFVNLFVSQKYPLLFWLAVPAAVAAWRRRKTAQGQVLMAAGGLAAVSFFFVAANPKLVLVPRYFISVAWIAATFAGWGLALAWDNGRRALALGGVLLTVLAGSAALSVENLDPRVVERMLVRWVDQHPGQVMHTDAETYARSDLLFRFADVSRAPLSVAAPQSGDLFFSCPQCVVKCRNARRCRDRVADFTPQSHWIVVETIDGPRKPIARLADLIGLDRMLPRDIANRFMAPTGQAIIYRIP